MSDLKLFTLGSSRLEQAGIAVEIETRKALALLVYLAVTKQIHNRDSLATLFWPENDQTQGRTYLRRALLLSKPGCCRRPPLWQCIQTKKNRSW